MSFTWRELQYFLLCRRRQKVWFHLAGKAKLNPGNKKQSYAVEVNLSTHFKAKSPNPRKADIIWLMNPTGISTGSRSLAPPCVKQMGWKPFLHDITFTPLELCLSGSLSVNLASVTLRHCISSSFSFLLQNHSYSLPIIAYRLRLCLYPCHSKLYGSIMARISESGMWNDMTRFI